MKTTCVIILTFASLLFIKNAYGHNASETVQEIAVNEKLASYIPLDIPFKNEKGETVTIGELINKPTVIVPVYLSCNHTCPLLMLGLADVMGKSKLMPGKDYRALSVSFDEDDTPQMASEKKPGYLKAANISIPEDAWVFLTGGRESIKRFTEAAGFQFKREHSGFSHPVTLIFLAPDGKIVRYLYGVTFLPFEFEMAVTEASKGRAVSIARKALLYCMSYDSSGRRYVFNTLKVAATVIIIAIASYFIYLVAAGKKGSRRL